MLNNIAPLFDRFLDFSEILVAVMILLLQLSLLVWYITTILIAASWRY
jgi:hypothetical protein